MKIKIIILVSFIIVLSLIIREYLHIYTSDQIALSNLKLISTGSCYVPLNITNGEKDLTIVCPNNILYYVLHNDNRMLFHSLYIYQIGKKIEEKELLKVSNKAFDELNYYSVNSNLVYNYKHSEILNDTLIVKTNFINYKLDWEIRKAIIYILLSREINCCYNSEGGIINITNNKPR